MKRLGIRHRITLWYAAVFVLTVCLFASLCLHAAMGFLKAQNDEHVVRTAILLSDRIDADQGRIAFNLPEEDRERLTGNVRYALHTQSGVLADERYEQWMDAYPQDFNSVRLIKRGDSVLGIGRDDHTYWFLYDKAVFRAGREIGRLRVLLLPTPYVASLGRLKSLWVGLLVLSAILAAIGGMIISGRALRPLREITRTAREIGGGDLTKRLAFTGNDEIAELAGAFNEMTDSLERAFAREKRFTSDVSHELRTPLAVITANAENAEQEDKLEAYRRANATILQKSRHLQRMISQILTFAREREHADAMRLEETDLRRALRDLADEAAEWAEEKGIAVETDVSDAPAIQADQMLLTRLFLNLLENAVKYGRAGGWIRVRAHRSGEMAVISICDNGEGISEADLPHIFQRFYRGDRARSGEGAGLGLSFAEMIVRLHHGKIAANSVQGETCFVVELPLAPGNSKPCRNTACPERFKVKLL